jgi:hypothetical protein
VPAPSFSGIFSTFVKYALFGNLPFDKLRAAPSTRLRQPGHRGKRENPRKSKYEYGNQKRKGVE